MFCAVEAGFCVVLESQSRSFLILKDFSKKDVFMHITWLQMTKNDPIDSLHRPSPSASLGVRTQLPDSVASLRSRSALGPWP